MKKLLGGFLALLLVLALLPGTALAVENAESLWVVPGTTTQGNFDTEWGAGAATYTANADGSYTIQLLQDVTFAQFSGLSVGTQFGGPSDPLIILDLNGFTLKGTSIVVANYGNLVIRDSSAKKTGKVWYAGEQYLTAVNNVGNEMTIEGGTFVCDGAGSASYNAAISTAAGVKTTINGGTFECDKAGAIKSYGETVINGGTLKGTYGVVSQINSTGTEAGKITFPADSTAVVEATSIAFVVHGNGDLAGGVVVDGGTFDAPRVLGTLKSSQDATDIDKTAALLVGGGQHTANPSGYTGSNPVARLTYAGGQTPFLVGEKTVADAAAGAVGGDTIEVFSGNVQLTDLPDGVTVKNSGSGTVSVNGESVAPNDSITVDSGLPFQIVAQPKDSIVTEGNTATFTIGVEFMEGIEVTQVGYQWRKSTDGGKTFHVIEGANEASYTTSATTLANDGYQYDCIVFPAYLMPRQARSLPSLSDTNIKGMTEGEDYLRSKVVTLFVKEAGAEPEVPPTGDSPLLYAAVGAAVLCLLGLCLPALRKDRA